MPTIISRPLTASRTLYSSFQRRVALALDAPQLERADLGHARLQGHRHQLALRARRRPRAPWPRASAPSDRRGGRPRPWCPRDPRAASTTPGSGTRPARRPPGRTPDRRPRPRCPPPCRTAPRTAPCIGGSIPGTAGIDDLDADVVGARRAAADAHALAATDQAVVGGAVGDGEIEIGAGQHLQVVLGRVGPRVERLRRSAGAGRAPSSRRR